MLELDFSDFNCREFTFEKNGQKKTGYEFFKRDIRGYKVITYSITFFQIPEVKICKVIIKNVRNSDKASNFVWVDFQLISTTKK